MRHHNEILLKMKNQLFKIQRLELSFMANYMLCVIESCIKNVVLWIKIQVKNIINGEKRRQNCRQIQLWQPNDFPFCPNTNLF
jgi:hypothetical protein